MSKTYVDMGRFSGRLAEVELAVRTPKLRNFRQDMLDQITAVMIASHREADGLMSAYNIGELSFPNVIPVSSSLLGRSLLDALAQARAGMYADVAENPYISERRPPLWEPGEDSLEVDYARDLDDAPTFPEALAALEAHNARREGSRQCL